MKCECQSVRQRGLTHGVERVELLNRATPLLFVISIITCRTHASEAMTSDQDTASTPVSESLPLESLPLVERSLLNAVESFDLRAVEAAFNAGATLASCKYGVVALHLAASPQSGSDDGKPRKGSVALLRLLLDRGGISVLDAVITESAGCEESQLGMTLLHRAANRRDDECIEVARFLLSCGVDINARTAQGDTAVDLAEHAPLRDFLKRAGGRHGAHAVYYASKYRDVATLSAALDAGASANQKKNGETPLFAAALSGALACLRLLLSRGAVESVHAVCDDITPLHASVVGCSLQCTQLLLEAGANPSTASMTCKTTPLMTACTVKNKPCVQLLLQNDADPHAADVNGNTAMHYAAGMGAAEIVRMLVSAGARAGARNAQGQDVLQAALYGPPMFYTGEGPSETRLKVPMGIVLAFDNDFFTGDRLVVTPALVRLLIDAGASLRSHEAEADAPGVDPSGIGCSLSPLHSPLRTAVIKVRRLLAGGRTNSRQEEDKAWIDVIAVLLENGADPNERVAAAPLQLTLLHIAAKNNLLRTAGLLLAAGADPRAQDQDGNPPIAESKLTRCGSCCAARWTPSSRAKEGRRQHLRQAVRGNTSGGRAGRIRRRHHHPWRAKRWPPRAPPPTRPWQRCSRRRRRRRRLARPQRRRGKRRKGRRRSGGGGGGRNCRRGGDGRRRGSHSGRRRRRRRPFIGRGCGDRRCSPAAAFAALAATCASPRAPPARRSAATCVAAAAAVVAAAAAAAARQRQRRQRGVAPARPTRRPLAAAATSRPAAAAREAATGGGGCVCCVHGRPAALRGRRVPPPVRMRGLRGDARGAAGLRVPHLPHAQRRLGGDIHVSRWGGIKCCSLCHPSHWFCSTEEGVETDQCSAA